MKDITTGELTVFPGVEDLLSLLRILNYYTDKQELSLSRKGDEVILRSGLTKRNITLPRTLRGYTVKSAKSLFKSGPLLFLR